MGSEPPCQGSWGCPVDSIGAYILTSPQNPHDPVLWFLTVLAVAAALALGAPSAAQTPSSSSSPPECVPVDPALDVTIEQGATVVFTIDCQDTDGDLVGGTWFLDGKPIQTDTTTYPDAFVYAAQGQLLIPFSEEGASSVAFVGHDALGASSLP